ncbi:hypothetical protein WKW79_17345 [Variovorax robiniae]|uniref:Uncharacterized protein n=1 Tax=Variovorax robiniae TaxID=1836199 RepID=A0ABU8X9H3_9BURK
MTMNSRLASILCALALAAIPACAMAQDGIWKDRYGRPVPQTESRRTLNGLGGWVVVTPDTDWEEKWARPSVIGPVFTQAKKVPKGKPVFVLVFLGNPEVGADGRADVSCDLNVTGPDGRSLVQQSIACFQGVPGGARNSMYLSKPVLGITSEPSDPSGTWTVQVSLKDKLSGTALPLKTTFIVE